MTSPPPTRPGAPSQPSWGLGDAVAGWLVAMASVALLVPLLLAVFGYSVDDDLPMTMVALQYLPLWIGFVGVPVWAAATKGRGWIRDFDVRITWLDVPVAAVIGALAQLVLVPLVSLPVLWLADADFDELAEPARELGAKADDPLATLLLFVVVAVGAPIAEEIFFRGLVLGAVAKRFGVTWGVVGSSVFFGATHFQPLQFPALTMAGLVFALLRTRTGRLGPAIVAHMAFNAVTVANLVWGTG